MALQIGEWKQAGFNPARVFVPRGKAITIYGTNRWTGQPVNANGLTYEAWALSAAITAAFPDNPSKVNYAVDRNQNGTTNLSDHARGEALDIMIQRYDGDRLTRSPGDLDFANRLFDWLVASMREGPRVQGLRGRWCMGPYRIVYPLFDGRIAQAGEGAVVRGMNGSGDPHYDHIHISVSPLDRRTIPEDPEPKPEPRRTLRLQFPKLKGQDVALVQRVVGARVDPVYGRGVFGEVTDKAVRAFQMTHGLYVDGIVGPKTWAVIDRVGAP